LGHKWHAIAVRTLQFFRFTSLRYRTTEHFATILKALRGIRDFRKCWNEIHFEDGDLQVRIFIQVRMILYQFLQNAKKNRPLTHAHFSATMNSAYIILQATEEMTSPT